MAPSPLPVAGSTVSFWRADPHSLDDHRSTPDLPAQADITIVGAGFAGVATAHHILEHCRTQGSKTPSILILEARQACSGATGRNGGHMKPDPYTRPSVLAASHGIEVAAEFAEFEAKNLSAVKDLIEAQNIECDFVLTRALDVLMTDGICQAIKSKADNLRKDGLSVMRDVQFVEGLQAEQLSGIAGAKGCFSYTAGHLSPYKFVLHLLNKAVSAGVNLQTNTPVTSISDTEGNVNVTTPRGSVRTSKIVFATNAYTSFLLPEFSDMIVPVRGICSHIAPGKLPAPPLSNSYIIRWSGNEYEYLIPRLDGGIVVGGARSRYFLDLDSWYKNVEDDKLIEPARTHFDGYMQRVFRGWNDSGASTSKVWTGIMGYTDDGFPHIGVVPARENQYMLAGFNGHGMPQIFLAAKGVASMIMEGASFEETGIPRVCKATVERISSSGNAILDLWKDAIKADQMATKRRKSKLSALGLTSSQDGKSELPCTAPLLR